MPRRSRPRGVWGACPPVCLISSILLFPEKEAKSVDRYPDLGEADPGWLKQLVLGIVLTGGF
jgi:hypothetical protein